MPCVRCMGLEKEVQAVRRPVSDIKLSRIRVVDENNVPVPLSEAYLHHWLVFGPPNQGVCGGYLDYSFGVGAESRGTGVSFPDPHAVSWMRFLL